MSSTVCQSPQAQPSHVTNTAPIGAVISHACVNFPSTYPPLHPYTLIFQTNVMVCPQILTPSLDRAGTDLDMGKLAMSGFHSRPIIQMTDQHDMLRGERGSQALRRHGYPKQAPLRHSEGWLNQVQRGQSRFLQ